MKKSLLWFLPALLVLAVPIPAQAEAGRLDKGFSGDGKVTAYFGSLPNYEIAPPARLAWAHEGKVVVASGHTLAEYLPSGQRDGGFGDNGKVKIEYPEGRTLEVAGVAVDSRGRILVAGTTRRGESAASVFVSRYLPQGRPDRSFGKDGEVTDLGLPAPPPPADKALFPTPAITEPFVEAAGLAVDSRGRPLVTGGWISGFQTCYPFITESLKGTGYVARLGVDGSIDSSFGGDGTVIPDTSKEVDVSPIPDGGGVLSIGTDPRCHRGDPEHPELARVSANGETDERFGSAGLVALPFDEVPAIVRDRQQRLLLLGFSSRRKRLLSLRPNGEVDRRFGEDGGIHPPLAHNYRALAIDNGGRLIFAGSAGAEIFVERRRRNGGFDRSFGRKGWVRTRFSAEVRAQQILVGGGGKIVVGGTLYDGDRYGIALARYSSR
jgi:uncharacterized delta-60 repeat protein